MRFEFGLNKLFIELMLFHKAALAWYLISVQIRWGSKVFKLLHLVKIKNHFLVYVLNKKFVLRGKK